MNLRSKPSQHPFGISRRAAVQAGAVGLLGLGTNHLNALRAAPIQGETQPGGRAKTCIYIFLSGGLAQHESFDMKPRATDTIRGEFNPIDTATPGIQICEHLPMLAQPRHPADQRLRLPRGDGAPRRQADSRATIAAAIESWPAGECRPSWIAVPPGRRRANLSRPRLPAPRARLGELTGEPAHLHHRTTGGEGQHDRHLQQDPEGVADIVGMKLGETLGAIAPLQQESLAIRHPGELLY